MRVAGSGVERPAAPQRRAPGVAPEGAAKAAGPSVTAGRSPDAEGAQARRKAGRSIWRCDVRTAPVGAPNRP